MSAVAKVPPTPASRPCTSGICMAKRPLLPAVASPARKIRLTRPMSEAISSMRALRRSMLKPMP